MKLVHIPYLLSAHQTPVSIAVDQMLTFETDFLECFLIMIALFIETLYPILSKSICMNQERSFWIGTMAEYETNYSVFNTTWQGEVQVGMQLFSTCSYFLLNGLLFTEERALL